MSSITVRDGTKTHFNDRGTGRPILFSHGWPLSADAFEDRMFFLASQGFRCIAHARRGHSRSSQPRTSAGSTFRPRSWADEDQIVPIGAAARLSSKLIANAALKIYNRAPHDMCTTLKTQVNAELLAFIKSRAAVAKSVP